MIAWLVEARSFSGLHWQPIGVVLVRRETKGGDIIDKLRETPKYSGVNLRVRLFKRLPGIAIEGAEPDSILLWQEDDE